MFIEISAPKFILSASTIADDLGTVKPLTLWLQSSPSKVEITDLNSIVKLVTDKLRLLADNKSNLKVKFTNQEIENLKFNLALFKEKMNLVDNFVESLPIESRLRSCSRKNDPEIIFNNFQTSVYSPFILEIADDIEESLSIDPVSLAFNCLHVKNFPLNIKL